MSTRTFVHGVVLAAMTAAPAVASAQTCPPPDAMDRLRLDANRVRPGESLTSVVDRSLLTRSKLASTDPETLRRVTNAIAAKQPGQSDEEAAAAAMGFVVPAVVVAAGACILGILACTQDAREFEAACLEQTCPAGKVLDQEKCEAIAASDMQNCTLTCGTNGPDGDAGRACVDAPNLPPHGPFVPPQPIPPPLGGFTVACTDEQVSDCEVQSGTYTDSSTGDIIDRDCTLNDVSGDLSRCTCSCVEVVAVSTEVVIESGP